MKHRLALACLLLLSLGSASCRAVDLRRLEERQNALELRVAKLEGQVEVLSRK